MPVPIPTIVMKFGGSSIANAERIRTVAGIVKERLGERPVLVLSAMGDVTDHLLDAAEKALREGPSSTAGLAQSLAGMHEEVISGLGLGGGASGEHERHEEQAELAEIKTLLNELADLIAGISLIRELTPKTKDYLVSFGERLSVRIVAAYFNKIGVQARPLDAWDAGITSTGDFTAAEPVMEECREHIPRAVGPLVNAGIVPVVTGFIAKCYAASDDRTNPTAGDITTLGRGGSDLTATLIAAACGAKEAQVWKDVDGVLTADPRIVENARPVESLTYDEAAELAYFGAQVLHPRAMMPCIQTGVPVLVKNSYNPAAKGTRISCSHENRDERAVRAVTSKKNITLVDIVSTRMLGQSGFLAEVFAIFAAHKISIDVIATSEVSISLTIDGEKDLAEVRKSLQRVADVEVKTGKSIVTIIGDVSRSSEILARAFTVCSRLGIAVEMVSQGASKVNISFIVRDADAPSVIKALHKSFFESE
ncbi:MAG: aspartate kinase [Spirochaetaceae bacterium]|nr:aspartate kinase [Spirochaetaceae bacterium]